MKADGTRTVWGGRRHNCFSDADYHRLVRAHRRANGRALRRHIRASSAGRSTTNSAATIAAATNAAPSFQAWLKKKYGNLDELNRAWGTHFWGQRFGDWDEIPIPDDRTGDWAISNPSASLDWQRFTSDRAGRLPQRPGRHPARDVSASRSSSRTTSWACTTRIDYYDLAKPLDFVSWDNYPKLSPAIPYERSLAADVMRGLKKQNFLIMEQTAGPLGWSVFSRNPQPGELRKICYQQLAHGADGQIWFRWRSCTVGREQYWHGLLGHDGKAEPPLSRGGPSRQGVSQARAAAWPARPPRPTSRSSTTTTASGPCRFKTDIPTHRTQKQSSGTTTRCSAPASTSTSSGRATTSAATSSCSRRICTCCADDVANQLVEYVRGGGVLLDRLPHRRQGRNESGLRPHAARPAVACAGHRDRGVRIAAARASPTRTKSRTRFETDGNLGGELHRHSLRRLDHAEGRRDRSPATTSRTSKQFAAVTRNEFGNGIGWYVGTIVEEPAFYDKLIAQLLADAKIKRSSSRRPASRCRSAAAKIEHLLFVINHTDEEQSVGVPAGKRELISGQKRQARTGSSSRSAWRSWSCRRSGSWASSWGISIPSRVPHPRQMVEPLSASGSNGSWSTEISTATGAELA